MSPWLGSPYQWVAPLVGRGTEWLRHLEAWLQGGWGLGLSLVDWFVDVDDLLQILGQGRGCGGVYSLCVRWEREVRSWGRRV